ncbi:MAG: energy transducer TonB [Woeseiaceae bacterium]|nr:energy transducer TonB [Woeseiaceae bacterium]
MYVAEGHSPVVDGLSDAFGEDDSGFTETVTGLISSVARKFSAAKSESTLPKAPTSGPSPTQASDGLASSLLQNPKLMGIGAAALIVVAGVLYWLMSGPGELNNQQDDVVRTPSFAEKEVDFTAVPPTSGRVDVEALIDEARLARGAGQLFNPVGSNAIELFAAAMAADPDNSLIAAELDATIGQTLSMAESALLELRLDDTDAALMRVAAVDPHNVRLPFLTAQLAQMQLRSRLDEARIAIREDRFEDAGTSLKAARNLKLADTAEIDAVFVELNAARSAQQAGDVLEKAAARLDAGALLSPPNDNARYFYELVLSNDADNTAAHQGLGVIAAKLAFQARIAIDSGNLDEAEKLLADAYSVDATNNELAATAAALTTARDAIAEQKRRRAAAERDAAEQRRAAAGRQAEADKQAAANRQAAAALIATAEATTNGAESGAVQERRETQQDNPGIVSDSQDAGTEPTLANSAENIVPDPAPTQASDVDVPIAVSALNRTKYVAPKYPRSAQRRNLSGWVDIVFTVAIDGTVSSVEVRKSEPEDTFVNAATSAVEKWEFEPVVENGVVVEKRAGVRLMFALE